MGTEELFRQRHEVTRRAGSSSSRVVPSSSGWNRMLRNLTAAVRSHRHCAGVSGALQTRFTALPAQRRGADLHGAGFGYGRFCVQELRVTYYSLMRMVHWTG